MSNSHSRRATTATRRHHPTPSIAIIITLGVLAGGACSTSSGPAHQATTAAAGGTTDPFTGTPTGGEVEWPITECGTYSVEGCGPIDRLVDLDKPTFGMPTTILIDREGRELANLAGPAEWASADAVAFVKAAIGR